MFPSLILFTLVLCGAHARCTNTRTTCTATVTMSHQGAAIPFQPLAAVDVPLVLYFPCDQCSRATGTDLPLLIFSQAALARPQYYSRLSRRLARFGFVVAIPDYFSRNLFDATPVLASIKQFVLLTRSEGFNCPINGQFNTAKLITRYVLFDIPLSHFFLNPIPLWISLI